LPLFLFLESEIPVADCLVSFGSNVGDSRSAYAAVDQALRTHIRVGQVQTSSLIRTRPIGGQKSQADYLNGALRLQTDFPPLDLFHFLQQIEVQLGRIRDRRWGPRTADLDLLLYDRQVGKWPIDARRTLELPHPRMTFRRFVLTPAAQIAAEMWHDVARMDVGQLLSHLNTRPNAIAVLGDQSWSQETLEKNLSLVQKASASHLADAIDISRSPRAANYSPTSDRFVLIPIDSLAHWSSVQPSVKLLVEWTRDSGGQAAEWMRQISQDYAGPRLAIAEDDGDIAAEEIAAALASMRAGSIDS
jgi:2-amino-4-hydroxy-6-hydroxymethyldihydropteridine diphosphokinase